MLRKDLPTLPGRCSALEIHHTVVYSLFSERNNADGITMGPLADVSLPGRILNIMHHADQLEPVLRRALGPLVE